MNFIVPAPQVVQLSTTPKHVAQLELHKSQVLLTELDTVNPPGQVDIQLFWYIKVPLAHEIHRLALKQSKQGNVHG